MSNSRHPRRGSLLGVGVSITDYAEVTDCVIDAARTGESLAVAACAVHTVLEARRDPTFAAVLNSFDIVTPDGQPLRWGLRWTGQARLRDRVYGPWLTLDVCREAGAQGLPVFLTGGRAQVLDAMAHRLTERIPSLSIAGTCAGRFRSLEPDEIEADAQQILESGARIVFVGMGSPRQEWWIHHMRTRIARPMIAVGAAFDFHAGLLAQAPPWMQQNGLEWLYRLGREPKRLWRRYLVLTPRYLPHIAAQALGIREYPAPTDLAGADDRPCPG